MPLQLRELASAGVALAEADTDRRILGGLAVPYNTPSQELADGYREVILPGAVDLGAVIGLPLLKGHFGEPIGEVVTAWAEHDGVHIRAALFDTQAARDTLAQATVLGFSVGFEADLLLPRGGYVYRDRIDPFHFATTHAPAYKTSRITEIRHLEGGTMSFPNPLPQAGPQGNPQAPQPPAPQGNPQAPQYPAPQGNPQAPQYPAPQGNPQAPQYPAQQQPPAQQGNPAPQAPVTADQFRSLEAVVNDLRGLAQRGAGPAASPLAQYRSLEEYLHAVWSGKIHTRALVDQITADNPGLMQPVWVKEIVGIINQTRPFIQGTAGPAPLPPKGLELSWAYYDGDLTALIAEQLAEKTEISSHKISFKRGSQLLKTFAEGSDIALQLLQRSDPDYLTGYMQVLYQAWAIKSEMWHVIASETAAAGTVEYDPNAPGSVYQAVIEASAKVKKATGAPASIVAVREASWAGVAGVVDSDGRPLYPMGPIVNAPGTASGEGVQSIIIAGVPAVPVVGLVGPMLVTNGLATRWHEDGPNSLDATNVAQLGQDKAIYSYANTAVKSTAGIVKLVQVP